ncbi:ethanolamine ammonia-lyase reactivating factor EutA [Clostridium arbusti]|uniref:ethanolamine ammonia-lyase reactivating factor EutA n=1 Tax=Clostridium arbusti TaxID=1137848 RepID=UPI000289C730|nr:ethanolamine ammonia-lyase reactivating factor EutA [Clostridium arbusti]
MQEKILSVGIDIGTTTTQIIFSEITVQNTASSFLVPKIKITEKNIIYRSKIYFTPLLSKDKINLKELKKIILEEYRMAGVEKESISTGAIIITGETSKKENAEQVLNVLSDFAGDFVVATAGADLEAVLAGFGAGSAEISKNTLDKVINFDIGGGTTNAAIFSEGELIDSFALNIGGRLLRFDEEGNVIYISNKINKLICSLGLNISIGVKPELKYLRVLADSFANILFKISNNNNLLCEEKNLFIEHDNKKIKVQTLIFSGGVAEFIYSDYEVSTLSDLLKYGDIGPIIGISIREILKKYRCKILEPKEKIRATVIGAGSHSIKISGSTIDFNENILPIKNIPIIKLKDNLLLDEKSLCEGIFNKIKLYSEYAVVAIAFKGLKSPSYKNIQTIAGGISKAFQKLKDQPIIIVAENDFAKALGQILRNKCGMYKKIVCIDGISTSNGDYIDIGRPIAGAIPVMVKTLIFNS